MAELDKKIQKAQTDLVQAVLEAQEKRNLERVDMLVTNAIKQLKMSRFKPDQTTCLSLTYLARINPKVFVQSSAIKEVLKSLLRRDNGPANIKGKNDIVLPVLAANILLACCDASEVRTIILNKIEQWLGSNQKAADLVQHLLATLCMKCQNDQQTIATLIDMRHHWLQYLYDNFDIYGSVPSDLCASIRKLLHSETSCEALIAYLGFLIKHDTDINGLGKEISKFIIKRPISLNSMVKESECGTQLNKMILKIFVKLFTYLKRSPTAKKEEEMERGKQQTINDEKHQQMDCEEEPIDPPPPTTTATETKNIESETIATSGDGVKNKQDVLPKVEYPGVIVKLEPKEDKPNTFKMESKPNQLDGVKINIETQPNKNETTIPIPTPTTTKTDPGIKDEPEQENGANMRSPIIPSLYVRLSNCSDVIVLSRTIIEAVLTLLSLVEMDNEDECKDDFTELLDCWLIQEGKVNQIATIYEDFALTRPYNLPDKLRQKLVHSSNDLLIEFGLHGANIAQLLKLLLQFGSSSTTINKILKRLESIKEIELIKSEIKDTSYFSQLMEFYFDMGALGARKLHERLDTF